MKKAEKLLFVQKLSEQLSSATSVVLVDYTGLTVKLQQDLKNKLREVQAEMFIVKNTLLVRAGKEAKIAEDLLSDTVLSGPTAMIITESDPNAPLQVLAKFAKEKELPQLKVGVIEGKFKTKHHLKN